MLSHYGRGGNAPNTPRYNQRLAVIANLRNQYILQRPEVPVSFWADKESVPMDWLNQRLVEIDAPWGIRVNRGEYEFFPRTYAPPTTTGIRTEGGKLNADGNLIVGFGTGIDAKHADVSATNNVVMREFGRHQELPPPTGEFVNLSNVELKSATAQLAADLRHFEAKFERTKIQLDGFVGNERVERTQILRQARHDEFQAAYLPRALSIASEILRRTGPIELPFFSPIWFGGEVLKLGKLAGMDPVNFTAHFLDYIAARLSA